mmetsp:Transcript_32193/g.96494  ORF Transcript_32193/g.96494 Transcript_32193/m.96494 type:complete len:210 (-) Transcript_32193:1524-2153(-)
MDNPKGPDPNLLRRPPVRSRLGQQNLGGPPRKVRPRDAPPFALLRLRQRTNGILPPLLAHPKLLLLRLSGIGGVRPLRRHLRQRHDPIDQSVHHLEPRRRPGVDRRETTDVPGPHRGLRNGISVVGKDDVADFENLEPVREGRALVVLQSLEQPGQQGGAHHLIFHVGGIQQRYGGGDVPPEGGEIVPNRAQSVRQHLRVSRPSDLVPQ